MSGDATSNRRCQSGFLIPQNQDCSDRCGGEDQQKRPISHSLVSSGGEKLPLGCIDGLGRIGRLPAFLG